MNRPAAVLDTNIRQCPNPGCASTLTGTDTCILCPTTVTLTDRARRALRSFPHPRVAPRSCTNRCRSCPICHRCISCMLCPRDH